MTAGDNSARRDTLIAATQWSLLLLGCSSLRPASMAGNDKTASEGIFGTLASWGGSALEYASTSINR